MGVLDGVMSKPQVGDRHSNARHGLIEREQVPSGSDDAGAVTQARSSSVGRQKSKQAKKVRNANEK